MAPFDHHSTGGSAKLRYSREELLQSHPYATEHREAGYCLHGGFLEDGRYVSPRTFHRIPAVNAWSEALVGRGHPLLDCTPERLCRPAYPNARQQAFLLELGLHQTLWDSLTFVGVVEARGGGMCFVPYLDFQEIILEDIQDTTVGHLFKGLFWAHGADEAGDPQDKTLGGHDKMWFACRDAFIGADRYPRPELPATFSRPADKARELDMLPPQYERMIKSMMNILLLEARAESFFAFCNEVFATAAADPRSASEAAVAQRIVERIRLDEVSHILYLRAAISELFSFTFKLEGGGVAAGAEFLAPLWAEIVSWPQDEAAEQANKITRSRIETQMSEAFSDGRSARLMGEFDALAH